MDEVPSRRPGPGLWQIERMMRRAGHLENDERILEWKQGRIRRWRTDGSDQAIPKFHGLERIPSFNGMARMCYSSRCLYLVGADQFSVTDLGFIIRIWHTEPQSVCLIYSRFDLESDGNVFAVRWDSDEPLDEMAAFADRIRVRGMNRAAGLSAEWRERAKGRVAEITASAQFESELSLLDETQGTARRSRPRTVVGLWFRASSLGMTMENVHYQRQMDSGAPGTNLDDASVIEAASRLAARRYFGPRASPDRVAATAAQIHDRVPLMLPQKSSVEAVIRYASGDRTAVLAGIEPSVVARARTAFISYVLVNLGIKFELDKLICDAEALAFKRGFNPTLALEYPG
jgi:hypothetical protein